jgi:hypothetical protein
MDPAGRGAALSIPLPSRFHCTVDSAALTVQWKEDEMSQPIHLRLLEAKQRVRAKQKLEAIRREELRVLERESEKCRTYRKTLASEKADIDRLESYGLTGLFYTVLGTKEEKIEQERQEYLAAKLKHDESNAAIAEVKSELKRLDLALEISKRIRKPDIGIRSARRYNRVSANESSKPVSFQELPCRFQDADSPPLWEPASRWPAPEDWLRKHPGVPSG